MRNFTEVLTKMISFIPSDKKELLERMAWHIEDGHYKAPELGTHWNSVGKSLQEFFPLPKEDWEFEVLSEWTTLSIEQLKQQVEEYKLKHNK